MQAASAAEQVHIIPCIQSAASSYADSNRLRLANELTDFVIICNGRSWNVHRTVLAMHSPVLLRACAGGFKVGSWSLGTYIVRGATKLDQSLTSS